MKHYTVPEAAAIGRCSKATIHKAIKDGHLTSKLEGARRLVTTSRDGIAAAIKDNFPRARPHNASKPKPAVPAGVLGPLLELAQLPARERSALLTLAQKFTVEELELLAQL